MADEYVNMEDNIERAILELALKITLNSESPQLALPRKLNYINSP